MDHREYRHEWYESFDPKAMQFTIDLGDEELVVVPARYEVCSTCEGRGTHVNPSIDSHGLTAEDFDADPDFAEDYRSGVYDVRCNKCGGERVSPMIDETRITPELLARIEDHIYSYYRYQREVAHERMMGY